MVTPDGASGCGCASLSLVGQPTREGLGLEVIVLDRQPLADPLDGVPLLARRGQIRAQHLVHDRQHRRQQEGQDQLNVLPECR
jgi:hypothetical protein